MCRSIKVLRKPGEPTTPEEVSAAALQFIRKISGFRKPSKANTEAFDQAVAEVAEASQRLLETLGGKGRLRSETATVRESVASEFGNDIRNQ
jgi:hypothetical protein